MAEARNAASSSVAVAKQMRKPPSAVRDQVSCDPQRRRMTCSALDIARAATVAQRGPSASFTSSRPISLILPATWTVAGGASRRCSTVMMRKCRRSSRCIVVEVTSTGISLPSAHSNPGGQRITLSVFLLTLNCRDRRRTKAGRIDIDCPLADQVACRIAKQIVHRRIGHVDQPGVGDNCNWRLDAQEHLGEQPLDRGLLLTRMQRLGNVAPEQDKARR